MSHLQPPPQRDPFFELPRSSRDSFIRRAITLLSGLRVSRPWYEFFYRGHVLTKEAAVNAENALAAPTNRERRDLQGEISTALLANFKGWPFAEIAVARETAVRALLEGRIQYGRLASELEQLRAVPALRPQRPGTDTVWLTGTHAARANYPAAAYPDGSRFFETDRRILFILVSSAWKYAAGYYRNTLASIPVDLAAADAGFLFEVSDYSHLLQWTGSAWTWGPGDNGSGYYQLFESAPSGYGANAWQICDGSTVARLNADGTTTSVTLDDLSTAAYLKGGTSSAAVAGAGGTTANTVATNQATVVTAHSVIERLDAAGAGIWVFDVQADAAHASHNHTQDTHNHAPGTLELRNKQARLYFRR